jgi:hypothetical protein
MHKTREQDEPETFVRIKRQASLTYEQRVTRELDKARHESRRNARKSVRTSA